MSAVVAKTLKPVGSRRPEPRRPQSLQAIRPTAWLLSLISGVLQVVIFPLPNWTFLCWIAVAPLLIAVLSARRGPQGLMPATAWQAAALAYPNGLIFHIGTCYWVANVMKNYGKLSTPLAMGVMVLMCMVLALSHAAFGLLVALAAGWRGLGTRALLLAPLFWVPLELSRQYAFGFLWNPIGTVLVDNIPLSRIATVTGVWGLSFEILLVNTVFAAAFLGRRDRRIPVLAGTILLCGLLETGAYFQPAKSAASGTARLVQADIPIKDTGWSYEYFQNTLADLTRLSVPHPGEGMAGDPQPDLIIWPETPSPFFDNDPRFRGVLSQVARDAHGYVIAGTLGVLRGEQNTERVSNSASLVAPNGDWVARYSKVRLVPFGEYVPFKFVFGFAHKLTKEVGDFVPGTERMALPVHSYKLGIFICYESVYPNEIRQFADNGANLLVNISNDGWFGHTAAPEQHLRQARMRSVENHRWLLRSTNTGITASIDPYGRVVAQARRDSRLAIDVPYGVETGTTLYTRYGDWFPYLCAIISLGMLFLRPAFRRKVVN
ncbi:MAG TPA: apolipoprotein N-acyltransferase [Terriglobales bacterium]|nr:apolipoprotein N-acyltransferase [Terriglobales bacterium]